MTRISSYIIDQNIVGNDKWIGSDAQNNLRTKNFTPNNLADYFNGNNVIDIGTSIRYRYQTLDVGEEREQGTISFETEIGPQVNFSDITTFLIAKNTLKGNTVTDYLDFLVDSSVMLSKSSNINTFGYYKVTSIEPWIMDLNFFVVVVEFLDGNGFIYEDLDYLVSLVNKSSGSGGSQTLNQTLVNGNATDGEDIFLSDGDSILLDNGSKLKKGTTNSGNGGNNGIALKCSLDYEFKWEAGRMYIMQQNGIGIRETRYNFNVAPTVNDDDTKGYAVDSRWILDNGDLYICTDATEGAAVWELQGTIPTLQEVLTEGNTATDSTIELYNTINDLSNFISSQEISIENSSTNDYSYLSINALSLHNEALSSTMSIQHDNIRRIKGSFQSDLLFTNPTANRSITFKDESGTVALTSDITIPTLQQVLEEGNITTEGVIFGDPLNDYISIGSGAIGLVDTATEKQVSISAGQIVIGDNDLNYVEMSLPNGFTVGNFISQNAILNGSGLEISNDIIVSALASNFLQFYNFDPITPFTTTFSIDKLATDNGDYLYPTGPSSQLATLLDIPTLTSDLINDGENGASPYVTADQLPSNLNLFATDVSSDIPTYFKLVTSISDPDFNVTPVNIPTGTITTTGQFIAALATTANVLVGNPGIINLLTIGNVRRTSGSGAAEFYYEVYHRTSGGTETLVATSSKTPPINTNVYTEFLAAALLNNGVFLATDRIVVKYYADRVGSGSNPNYDFQFGGTSPVRTNFPVPATNIPLDATPTSGSTNGVQSGGVFDALALKANKTIQVTPVTITSGSWSLVGGLYESNYANVNILPTSIVDIIPSNASVPIVLSAQLLPQTNSSAGSVKIYATNLPLSNIIVTVNIMN